MAADQRVCGEDKPPDDNQYAVMDAGRPIKKSLRDGVDELE
jgi:hypothetical protein